MLLELEKYNQEFGFSEDFIQLSFDYLKELIEYNKKVNLISRKDEKKVVLNHWVHCVLAFKVISKLDVERIADIGSGGGLPGVLLALFFKDKKVILIESIKKKTDFLNSVCNNLSINNVEIINERIENVKSERYDLITARAVSKISNIWEKTHNLLHKDGFFLTWKGSDNENEVNEFKNKFHNFQKIQVLNHNYKFTSDRIQDTRLILITK